MRLKSLLLISSLTMAGCVEFDQRDPEAEFNAFAKKEEEKLQKKLDGQKTGESPKEDSHAEAIKDYSTYCASCHGNDGKANTPVAQVMDPKPRSLTDAAWQESVSDEKIFDVISKGGAANGLAATMAPWGGILSDEKIHKMVSYIRSLK